MTIFDLLISFTFDFINDFWLVYIIDLKFIDFLRFKKVKFLIKKILKNKFKDTQISNMKRRFSLPKVRMAEISQRLNRLM